MHLIIAFLICFTLLSSIQLKSKEEWKTRVIYQLLTDRFAKSVPDQSSSCDLRSYCGGTFEGIKNNLDYITGMGFNAIWISPIIENTENSYHGYHMTNIYKINPRFGSEEELIDLIETCHSKNVWVMVDVVANHVGPVGSDYRNIVPFNDPAHYHDNCQILPEDFAHNQYRVENCRLADLPDLKQENEFVRVTLLDWIKMLVSKYNLDGIRIDTVPEIPKWFWKQFADSAGIFQIGEVFDGRKEFVADYQKCCLDSVLNYPLYFTIKEVFITNQSMYKIESCLMDIKKFFKDTSVLGVFINNHDNARILSQNANIQNFKNAIMFMLMTDGIPIFYYGDEQFFNGGNDPLNRETLFAHLNTDSLLYKFTHSLVNFRVSQILWNKQQIQRYVDDNFYAFTRENVLALFTNTDTFISRTITYHSFEENTKLCNLFDKDECVYVRNKRIDVTLNGDSKIYIVVK